MIETSLKGICICVFVDICTEYRCIYQKNLIHPYIKGCMCLCLSVCVVLPLVTIVSHKMLVTECYLYEVSLGA